jgi:urea transport system substrate-binding protein
MPLRRTTITRPALWIAVPTFVVSPAVAASLKAGIFAALVVGLIGAALAGVFAERRLARIIFSIDRIARGDRYTSLPELVGDGAIQQFAGTAETVRAALIEADTVSVDQLRRETEARLHHAGRLFFTGNFRRAVEEVVNAFTSAGERIRRTATELGQSNRHMAQQVTAASDAAAQAAADVAGVAAAACDVETLVMNSAQQAIEARAATKRTSSELARADATMRTLAGAAQREGDQAHWGHRRADLAAGA